MKLSDQWGVAPSELRIGASSAGASALSSFLMVFRLCWSSYEFVILSRF